MKTVICIITLLSFPLMAQQYQAPKVEQPKWSETNSKDYKNEGNWVSDYKMKDTRAPAESDEKSKNKLRKPSSGEEVGKPKFWDFKVVK